MAHSHSREGLVYLGLDSNQAWRQTFGRLPGISAKLKKLLAARV